MNKVCIYENFEDLRTEHEKIFDEASGVSGIFLSLPWFRHLFTSAFTNNKCLRIYSVESSTNDCRPFIVLPMCHQTSTNRWLAARNLTALANYYTSLFSPLISAREQDIQSNLNLLAQTIATDSPSWDTIDLHPMEIDSPLFNATHQAFHRAGLAVQSYFCFGNWYLQVNSRTFQQYFDKLPSKLRNTINRKTRQLDDANRLYIEIISEPDDVAKGTAAYEKIYHASWKSPESFPEFMPGLIQMCADKKWLRLGVAYIDNQPAAAQLWIMNNKTASIYKLAYDQQFSALSIGSILTAHMMRHVIDVDHVQEVDYLTGDDAYKQDWMSHRRERWGIVVFNLRTLTGALSACTHFGGRMLKKFLPH